MGFLEESEWDIDSYEKMSNFSKESKLQLRRSLPITRLLPLARLRSSPSEERLESRRSHHTSESSKTDSWTTLTTFTEDNSLNSRLRNNHPRRRRPYSLRKICLGLELLNTTLVSRVSPRWEAVSKQSERQEAAPTRKLISMAYKTYRYRPGSK